MKRGDIYYVNLSPVVGSEQGGMRPVVIIQNDIGNRHSPTVIVASLTSQIQKAKMPTHVEVDKSYGLPKNSVILCEQIRTIDKSRLMNKVGQLDASKMKRVDHAIAISLGMVNLGNDKAS